MTTQHLLTRIQLQHHHQAAMNIPNDSFHESSLELSHKTAVNETIIRQEVISCDVKPLNSKPYFPRQAQAIPLINSIDQMPKNYGNHLAITRQVDGSFKKPINLVDPPGPHGNGHFFYIHRHNSFIDVNNMTHHDHSLHEILPPTPGSRSYRSDDEFDAALTLVTCLNKN